MNDPTRYTRAEVFTLLDSLRDSINAHGFRGEYLDDRDYYPLIDALDTARDVLQDVPEERPEQECSAHWKECGCEKCIDARAAYYDALRDRMRDERMEA